MQNKKNLTNFVEAIKLAIFQSLKKDKNFFLMGEGVNDLLLCGGQLRV